MHFEIIVHSQLSTRHAKLSYVQRDRPRTFLSNISHIPNIYPQDKNPEIFHINHNCPRTLPAADRASRESKQHTRRDFMSAARGAFPSSPPAIYTAPEGQRACQWQWRAATTPLSSIVSQSSCLAQSQRLKWRERSRKKVADCAPVWLCQELRDRYELQKISISQLVQLLTAGIHV